MRHIGVEEETSGVLKKITLVYQFAYFWLVQEFRKGAAGRRQTGRKARYNALTLIMMFEVWLLVMPVSIYDIAVMSMGYVIHRSHLSKSQMFPYGIVAVAALFYFNATTFAPPERVEYYKSVFKGWSREKRTRWKVYVVSIVVLTVVVGVLLANQNRKMLQP